MEYDYYFANAAVGRLIDHVLVIKGRCSLASIVGRLKRIRDHLVQFVTDETKCERWQTINQRYTFEEIYLAAHHIQVMRDNPPYEPPPPTYEQLEFLDAMFFMECIALPQYYQQAKACGDSLIAFAINHYDPKIKGWLGSNRHFDTLMRPLYPSYKNEHKFGDLVEAAYYHTTPQARLWFQKHIGLPGDVWQ